MKIGLSIGLDADLKRTLGKLNSKLSEHRTQIMKIIATSYDWEKADRMEAVFFFFLNKRPKKAEKMPG